ncbi:hypothetical protein ABK040_009687 [Willaertia magna]
MHSLSPRSSLQQYQQQQSSLEHKKTEGEEQEEEIIVVEQKVETTTTTTATTPPQQVNVLLPEKYKPIGYENPIERTIQLIEQIKICMFTTYDLNYNSYSRPMFLLKTIFHNENDKENNKQLELYFLTNKNSKKLIQLQQQTKVNISFNNHLQFEFISLNGITFIEFVNENNFEFIEKQLWNEQCKYFFPKGVNDENICLLKIIVKDIRYWDKKQNCNVDVSINNNNNISKENDITEEFNKCENKSLMVVDKDGMIKPKYMARTEVHFEQQ